MKPRPEQIADPNSRTGKKKFLATIHKIALELMAMNDGNFAAIELDDDIRKQIQFTRDLKSPIAKRRQLRFLCRYIAEGDFESVVKAVEGLRVGKTADSEHFQDLESYRERLIAGTEATIDEIMELIPGCDPKELRRQQLQCQQELKESKGVTAARALFRYLRKASEKKPTESQSD